MNVSQIGIYSTIARTNVGNASFNGNENFNVKGRAGAMLDSYVKPVTDYDVTHLDLPDYTKPEKRSLMDRFAGTSPEFEAMQANTSSSRLEKSIDAADKVTRYTLQQIMDGSASVSSSFNYKGLDSTKEIGATFRNGISVSLRYNLVTSDKPNVITVSARSGEKQEIWLYNNGFDYSKRVEKLRQALLLV